MVSWFIVCTMSAGRPGDREPRGPNQVVVVQLLERGLPPIFLDISPPLPHPAGPGQRAPPPTAARPGPRVARHAWRGRPPAGPARWTPGGSGGCTPASMPMGVMACFWVMQGRCGASLSLVWRPGFLRRWSPGPSSRFQTRPWDYASRWSMSRWGSI